MEFDRAALLSAFGPIGRAAWDEGATIEIGLRTFEEAVALVDSFYPRSQLRSQVQFGLEEIVSGLADDGGTGP